MNWCSATTIVFVSNVTKKDTTILEKLLHMVLLDFAVKTVLHDIVKLHRIAVVRLNL